MSKQKIYRCFSRNLKEFLEDNGEEIVVKAINPDDNRTMWIFNRNNNLDKLLTKWSNNKPIRE